MFFDILAIDFFACFRACGQIEEGAGLEGNEQRFVDDRDAVHLPFGRLQCVVIALIQENRRKADDILFYGDGRQAHIFRKIEGPRLARKELDHEREALILWLMKAIELLLAIASLARLISACIQKRLEGRQMQRRPPRDRAPCRCPWSL